MKLTRFFTKQIIPLLAVAVLCQPVLAAPIELSLDDCIALALKNNPDMIIANMDRNKSHWAVKEAQAGKGATVSYTHTDSRYNTPPTSTIPYYTWSTVFDNEIALSVPVYSGGKLESQIKQAKLNLNVADLTVEATKQQLKQTVTNYYFSVLQYHNELEVSQETVNNYLRHLKDVQAQYNVGTVSKADVLSSEVSLANAQDSLITAQNNYELAMSNLNNTTGLPLESVLQLKEQLQYEPYPLQLEDCVQYALKNRPEMAQQQAKIAIAKEDGKIAKSGYLPSVTFAAAQDWYDEELPGTKNSNWLVSLTASFSVFDSGLNKAKVKQAQYNLHAVTEEARQEQDSIALEVRQYYLNMREAEKRMSTGKVAVEQALENLKIAEVRYSAGVGTNLDVLDSVLALNKAKTNDIQALYDYNTNKAQLVKAMGVPVQ
jgi:outer membrane protein TolC